MKVSRPSARTAAVAIVMAVTFAAATRPAQAQDSNSIFKFLDAVASEMSKSDGAGNRQAPAQRGDPSIFATSPAPGTFEQLLKQQYPDDPARAARQACESYGGRTLCEEYLRPRVEEETAKVNQRKAEAAAKQMKQREEEEEKKRQKYANPQKAAADLATAEARLARATEDLVKLKPQVRADMKRDYALWEARTTGLCREMGGNWTAGSTEARIDITDCWTAYTNMRIEWIEKAVGEMRAEVQNVPLRIKAQ